MLSIVSNEFTDISKIMIRMKVWNICKLSAYKILNLVFDLNFNINWFLNFIFSESKNNCWRLNRFKAWIYIIEVYVHIQNNWKKNKRNKYFYRCENKSLFVQKLRPLFLTVCPTIVIRLISNSKCIIYACAIYLEGK